MAWTKATAGLFLVTATLTGCPDDGRKSGAAGIEDAQEELAEFQCSCFAEQFGITEQQCRQQIEEASQEVDFPFECIDNAVSGNAQAQKVFDCVVDATYDYVDCLIAEGCEAADEELLMCADGGTYTEFDVCDGFQDCEDGTDEAMGCATEPFTCPEGSELSASDVCDGFPDCDNGEDEQQDCPESCDSVFVNADVTCGQIPVDVEADIESCFPSFTCADGDTIDASWECDGDMDCADGSDEASCTSGGPGRLPMRLQRLAGG